MSSLAVGDEDSFVSFAERMIFEMQCIWRTKEGLDNFPVVDMSAKIEDLIYNDALTENNLSLTAHVWGKRECIVYYQETFESVLKHLEYKQINWKKICEDNEKNPRYVLNVILKEDDGRKHKISSGPPKIKAPRQPKQKTHIPKAPAAGGAPKAKKQKVAGGRNSTTSSNKISNIGIAGIAASAEIIESDNNPVQLDALISEANLDEFGFDFESDKNGDAWNF